MPRYNGKRGEAGYEAQVLIANAWVAFLQAQVCHMPCERVCVRTLCGCARACEDAGVRAGLSQRQGRCARIWLKRNVFVNVCPT